MSPASGLYLHVPFCARICPYCDFAVRTGSAARRARWVEHLLREIELYADDGWEFETLYFGGGTPSSLAAEELARIVETVFARLPFRERRWIFLEANPEDVSRESVAAWRRLGVDTLSLGVQALEPTALAFLGRQHNVSGARRAVADALEAGFTTVSIDLIYGLPGQGPDDWRAQLDVAVALGAQHLSCYQLTIHDRTRFGLLEQRGQLTQLPQDAQADLFRLTHRHLDASGFQSYEVSQFALAPEHRSRHNLKYWDHTPYLGLGPAAHSFRDDRRWWNRRRTGDWKAEIEHGRRPVEGEERLDARALALEALMTGLRRYAGVDLARLRARTDIDLVPANRGLIERLEAGGLLTLAGDRLVPTLDGLAVADGLAAQFEVG